MEACSGPAQNGKPAVCRGRGGSRRRAEMVGRQRVWLDRRSRRRRVRARERRPRSSWFSEHERQSANGRSMAARERLPPEPTEDQVSLVQTEARPQRRLRPQWQAPSQPPASPPQAATTAPTASLARAAAEAAQARATAHASAPAAARVAWAVAAVPEESAVEAAARASHFFPG